MKKDKIFVYQAMYGDGDEFAQDVHVELFFNEKDAIKEMKKDYEEVRKEFIEHGYDESDLETDTSCKNVIFMSANYNDDWWEGKVFEQKVKGKEKSPSKRQIKKAEKCLKDNGIEKDEVDIVLQALGYILLDEELYPEEE